MVDRARGTRERAGGATANAVEVRRQAVLR